MAALTAPRLLSERKPIYRLLPVKGGTIILQGNMVAHAGGLAVMASADPTLTVLGIAEETYDNRLGAAGAIKAGFSTGCYSFDNDPADPVTLADVGKPVFVTDSVTLSRTNGGGTKPEAGIMFDLDSAGVWVDF